MKRVLLSLISYLLSVGVSVADTNKPWTFWYWMYGAVSEAGIHADLQAMKDVGLGGCYLMPIRGTQEKPEYQGEAQQLSPRFWQMVDYAMLQSDSLGLEMGIHICDGFALAGGPWITPAESMQKIVSMQTNITGGTGKRYILMQPGGYEGYYEDIACFAIPSESCELCVNPATFTPVITCSPTVTRDENGTFRASEPGWIQYEYPEIVTFSSVEIIPSGNNFQSQRLKMSATPRATTGTTPACGRTIIIRPATTSPTRFPRHQAASSALNGLPRVRNLVLRTWMLPSGNLC